MKKPNVLNRSMFNRGGTSAYGKGITSNLVSDEQRQRFNYGGRVKLQYGTPWKDFGWSRDPGLGFQYPEYPGEQGTGSPMKDWWDTQRSKWNLRQMQDYADQNVEVGEDVESQDPYQGSDPRYFKPKFTQEDWSTSDLETPGDVPVVEEKEEVITQGPMGDEMWDQTTVRDDTDELDTPDRWAFLDENIAKKKKLARGHALMEGAAAAADWAFADTKAKQGAAISKGLRGAGTIGAKYKGEAEDIKTKAKILGTVEDIKGEQKQKLFEDRRKGYYEPSLELQREGLELKKDAAKLLAEGEDGLSVYNTVLRPKEIRTPQAHQELIQELTGKTLMIEDDANSKELRSLEKDGLIFIDKLGKIKKNDKGNIISWNIRTDPLFTWKNTKG